MNYFEHHIGDYDADTAHLSWVEDMAYTRLLRLYYRKEAPIPADVGQACRLVRATGKEQREAVAAVLAEFFILREDGWHQRRADFEIERYQTKAARNREVGKLGGRPPKNKTQTEPTGNPDGFCEEPKHNPPQTPDPIPNNQEKNAPGGSSTPPARTLGAQASMRMKDAGMAGVSPSHPKLIALLDAGITLDELADAAADAVSRGKPFAYALSTAEGRRRDSATAPLPAAGATETPWQRSQRERAFELSGGLAARKAPGAANTHDTFDMEPTNGPRLAIR